MPPPKLKIDLLPASLSEAARRVSCIPVTNSPNEAYHYMSLIATPDKEQVRVFAAGPTCCGIARVAEAQKSGGGQIVLSVQQFMSLIGGLDTAASFVISDKGRISMSSSGWSCKLPLIETKLTSPVLTKTAASLTLRVEPLVMAVQCAMSAVGKGAVLGFDVDSVLFDFAEHTKPRIAASDGAQLAVVTLPVVSEEPQTGLVLKIPAAACKAFVNFFSGEEGLVRLRYDANVLCAWNDSGVLYMSRAHGTPLPIDRVIAASSASDRTRIAVAKRELTGIIKRASVVLKGDESRRVILEVKDKTLTATCESPSAGLSVAECGLDSADGGDACVEVNFRTIESAVSKIMEDTIVLHVPRDGSGPLILDCPPVWWTIAPFERTKDTTNDSNDSGSDSEYSQGAPSQDREPAENP